MVVSEGAAIMSSERRDERDVEMQSTRIKMLWVTRDLKIKSDSRLQSENILAQYFFISRFHLKIGIDKNFGP